MGKIDFRHMAQQRLKMSKDELKKADAEDDRIAALYLRMAIEALVYDRAAAYKNDFSQERYGKWQPKKVFDALIAIDPNADATASIHVGLEEEYGKPSEDMKYLGQERPIKLKEIKDHYDALGSYLHTPTLDQLQKGGANMVKLRKRCDQLVQILDAVMKSTVWNFVMSNCGTIDCSRCGATLTKTIDPDAPKRIECFDCGAPYEMEQMSDKQIRFKEIAQTLPCPAKPCEGRIKIWEDQIEDGARWTCETCSNDMVIEAAYRLRPVVAKS